MSWANIMNYINITKFLLINELEKDHSMVETRRLKNVVIFIEKVLSFVLSRKIINIDNVIASLKQSSDAFFN